MRSRSVLGWVLSVLGVLLLAAAAILYWVVVPGQAKVPSDTNTTRNYDGTAKVLVNPQALAAGDRANGVLVNVPVKAARTVQVIASTSSAAQVTDKRTLTSGSGQPIGTTTNTYAVDRKTLEATDNHPSDWNVEPHQGLTVNFPIGTKKQDYTGWVSETQTTTPLKYVRDEQRNGITTYVFQADVKASAIKDKQVLGALPPALPKTLLGQLGSALPIPDQLKTALAQALPSLTEPVQLAYTYSATATYWVEPNTGRVVDLQREEIRQAGLASLSSAPGIPIYDVSVHYTNASVTDAVNDAKSDSDKLTLYGKTLPLIFLIVGGVALIAGVLVLVLGRRSPRRGLPPTSPAPTNLTP
jgi:hypothetical protein